MGDCVIYTGDRIMAPEVATEVTFGHLWIIWFKCSNRTVYAGHSVVYDLADNTKTIFFNLDLFQHRW